MSLNPTLARSPDRLIKLLDRYIFDWSDCTTCARSYSQWTHTCTPGCSAQRWWTRRISALSPPTYRRPCTFSWSWGTASTITAAGTVYTSNSIEGIPVYKDLLACFCTLLTDRPLILFETGGVILRKKTARIVTNVQMSLQILNLKL